MSGDQLRNFATLGLFQDLKNQLSGGANPCSVCEEQGLTALHYAVWNGHTECVKLLLANDCGRHPVTGGNCRASSLKSKSGYTSLHIAAMLDNENKQDICKMLILSGADVNDRDNDGKSAVELAMESQCQNTICLLKSSFSKTEVTKFTIDLKENYTVIHRRSHSSDKISMHVDRRDLMVIPKELEIHEHHIMPKVRKLIESDRSDGAKKIRELDKLLNIAECALKRREKLVHNAFRV